MREKTKTELLNHYAKKEPKAFRQYDGWPNYPDGDSVIRPDADGDALTGSSETWELMNTDVGVRVLVPVGTTMADAVRLLRKIINWIEQVALLDAALEAHPDWNRGDVVDVGGYPGDDGWLGKPGAPSGQALVDWFRATYPEAAKAIEHGEVRR